MASSGDPLAALCPTLLSPATLPYRTSELQSSQMGSCCPSATTTRPCTAGRGASCRCLRRPPIRRYPACRPCEALRRRLPCRPGELQLEDVRAVSAVLLPWPSKLRQPYLICRILWGFPLQMHKGTIIHRRKTAWTRPEHRGSEDAGHGNPLHTIHERRWMIHPDRC